MSDRNHFHIGILVADLNRAIDRFSEALGVTFIEPTEQVTVFHDPDPVECVVRAAYSVDGPPYLELVEGQGDGVFCLAKGEGLHHLGIWAPADFDTYATSDMGRQLPATGHFCFVPNVPSIWLTDPGDLHGVRLELLDAAMRPSLEQALSSGRMPG